MSATIWKASTWYGRRSPGYVVVINGSPHHRRTKKEAEELFNTAVGPKS